MKVRMNLRVGRMNGELVGGQGGRTAPPRLLGLVMEMEIGSAATRLGVGEDFGQVTQGGSCLATLGFGPESRWDSPYDRDAPPGWVALFGRDQTRDGSGLNCAGPGKPRAEVGQAGSSGFQRFPVFSSVRFSSVTVVSGSFRQIPVMKKIEAEPDSKKCKALCELSSY